jgi:pilus assembly protein Flp/PilA
MNRSITTFISDESGATAVEYGLICAGIAAAIIAIINALGAKLVLALTDLAASINTAH